jgi:hypothetical protein
MPSFTEDGRYIALKIKPLYADVRQAKIKKKKTEEFPKDSLGIYDLNSMSLEKIPGVLSFKIPENSSNWLAYQLANKPIDSVKKISKKDTFATVPDTGKSKIPLIIEQTPDKKQKRKLSANGENDVNEEDAEVLHNWMLDNRQCILVSGAFGRGELSTLFRKSYITDIIRAHRIPIFVAHR